MQCDLRGTGFLVALASLLIACNPALQAQRATGSVLATGTVVATGTSSTPAASVLATASLPPSSATATVARTGTLTFPFTSTVTLPPIATPTTPQISPTPTLSMTVPTATPLPGVPAPEPIPTAVTTVKPLPGQPTEGLQRLRDQSYPFYLLIQAQANGTLDSTADSLGAELDDARARVHVLLDARAGAEESAANVVVANGGSIVGRGEDLISCWLPITNLAKLARDPSIIGLRLARPPILSWAGDNTKLINSPTWNLAGYDGDGVKVAVIDADGVALVL